MNTPPPVVVAPQATERPSVQSEPLARRLLRSVALLVLAVVFTLLLGLALLSSIPLLNSAVQPLFAANADSQAAGHLAGIFTLLFIVLVPILLLLLAWRLRLRSWWWIGGGCVAVAPVLVYLASDDPVVLHPTTIEEIAPAFPGAEQSYAVLMRYSKQHPTEEAKAFDRWKQRIIDNASPDKPAEWKAYLEKNRAAIEADWADLAPQRRWLAELNAFDRIGDLGTASVHADIIAYKVWRVLTQRTVHVAGLRMLDGQPEEAIATLLPMLQAGRKLQPSGRTLVRLMVGIVVEKMTTLYALDIVEHATVSAETKARLAAALAGGMRGEAGARRLVGIEQALALGYFEQPIGDLLADVAMDNRAPAIQPVLNLLSPFVYNPRRTINRMSELTTALQDLASRREPLDGPRAKEIQAETTRPHFKNFAGAILIDRATPAYTKVVSTYWYLHDQREKLAATLRAAK